MRPMMVHKLCSGFLLWLSFSLLLLPFYFIGNAMADTATIIAAAQSQLGKPYVWATPSNPDDPNPKSFDCSGLSMWCYKRAGVSLTHFTGTQYTQMQHRSVNSAQPADLVFYAPGRVGVPYHVAINIGNGQLIEAPEVGIPVRVRSWSPSDSDVMTNVGYSSAVLAGTVGGQIDPHPPIAVSGLKPPLNVAKRNVMIAYLESHGTSANTIQQVLTGSQGDPNNMVGILDGKYDAQLIKLYTDVVNGIRYNTPGSNDIQDTLNPALNPVTYLEKLFNPQLWVRIAEFVVGGALLFIAANAILKETTGTSIKPPKVIPI